MARDLTQEEKLDEADRELKEEVEKWDQMGLNIQMVMGSNPVASEIGFKCLINYLKEILPDFDTDYFLTMWRIQTKEALVAVRQQVREARLRESGVALPSMAIPGEKPKIERIH